MKSCVLNAVMPSLHIRQQSLKKSQNWGHTTGCGRMVCQPYGLKHSLREEGQKRMPHCVIIHGLQSASHMWFYFNFTVLWGSKSGRLDFIDEGNGISARLQHTQGYTTKQKRWEYTAGLGVPIYLRSLAPFWVNGGQGGRWRDVCNYPKEEECICIFWQETWQCPSPYTISIITNCKLHGCKKRIWIYTTVAPILVTMLALGEQLIHICWTNKWMK